MSELFSKYRGRPRRDSADSLEIARIIDLPVVDEVDLATIEAFCAQEVQGRYFDEGFRLFATQVGAVLAFDLYGGGFFPVGVGWGKTVITLMIANRAYERGDSTKSILFVPPDVYEQLTRIDIPQARKWVGLSVPFHLLGGRTLNVRTALTTSGRSGCYIMPYSLLSVKDSEDMLGAIAPDLMILDEAHNVKNPKAARTKRLRTYINARQPVLVALSGTITSKSINDYHHLIAAALGELSPLPMSDSLSQNWSYVLDPEKPGEGSRGGKTGPLTPLVDWAKRNFPDEKMPEGVAGFRKAYRLRLTSAPGVVSTGDAEIGVSLTLCNEPVAKHDKHPDFPKLKALMTQVEDLWRSPSGDEIKEGFHKWRYLYELTTGFYYRLRWPEIEELTAKGITEVEAEAYLAAAKEHHEANQIFSSALRKWIQYQGRKGMDTPLLVTAAMARNQEQDVGASLYILWRAVKDLEFEGMPVRISEPVRVCDYKIMAAVEWAKKVQKKKKPGLIWFHHDEPGRWMIEELEKAGVDAVWCPSDSVKKGTNELVIQAGLGKGPHKDKILVVSIGGHGTGKNLQHNFEESFFLQFPRQAPKLEQVIGRTHRNGQPADALSPVTCNTTEFDHQNNFACLIDALYIHQTTGTRQKAIYASYNPMPRQYPSDFLRERGFEGVKKLDSEGMRHLREKFGTN